MGHILHPSEVDYYISSFKTSKLEEIGSLGWFGKHKRLLQLQQQSILEVNESIVESVKELTAFHKKIINLVEETISMSIWREKVLKELLKLDIKKECSFFVYVIMFHETTALGLLQNILYHQDAAAELGDFALELVDYCVANIIRLTTNDRGDDVEDLPVLEHLKNKEKNIAFDIGTKCVSVLRFLIETLADLPLSITTRIYDKHDVPLLLCQLVSVSPWTRSDEKGRLLKYVDSKWHEIAAADRQAVTVTEGQVWLALRHLLLDEKCHAHYDIDACRRSHLLKLQCHLTEPVLDQIAPLAELKYFLSRLEIMDPSSTRTTDAKKPFILEVITEYRSSLADKPRKYFKKLAQTQLEVFEGLLQDGGAVDLAKDMAAAYETLDQIDAESAKCGNCGEVAKRFCSRCKLEYYCGRECQVKAWPRHKNICETYGDKIKK
ncbi:zinc finger MYND domain-containing protein 10 [Nilaparvata lugens]|uniref:zinc finger MYND domain-containing protein 10 n=1 Tax=Nilaparvata lugens TaxID=108931 RepID=UPI00193E20AB|nr:zinc finger MYND domain-containing protein 10 [Nilaparvata lugens]